MSTSVLTFYQNQGPKGNNNDKDGRDDIQIHSEPSGRRQKQEPSLWICESLSIIHKQKNHVSCFLVGRAFFSVEHFTQGRAAKLHTQRN